MSAKKITKQEIIADLKRVFEKLGRPFNTADYSRHGKFHRDNIPKNFKNFQNALVEAGLDTKFKEYRLRNELQLLSKTDSKVKSLLPKWAKRAIKKITKTKKNNKDIFIIPDLHFCFANDEYLDQMLDDLEQKQPAHVIQIGDMFDFYSFSRFSKSVSLNTPREEFLRSQLLVEKLWDAVKRIVPKAKLYQLSGNHEARLTSRLLSKSPELEPFMDFAKPFEIEGVTRIHSSREHIEIEGIIFCHGFFTPVGAHVKHFNKSVVFGHSHKGSVTWFNENLFELNVGHGADVKSLPLSYTASTITKWKTGWGFISFKNNKPYPEFIPFYSKKRD